MQGAVPNLAFWAEVADKGGGRCSRRGWWQSRGGDTRAMFALSHVPELRPVSAHVRAHRERLLDESFDDEQVGVTMSVMLFLYHPRNDPAPS